MSFSFLMIFTIYTSFLCEIGPIEWILSQHCEHWSRGALAPGYQQPQFWACTNAFPVVYGLTHMAQWSKNFGRTEPITLLLMPRILELTGHQQLWYSYVWIKYTSRQAQKATNTILNSLGVYRYSGTLDIRCWLFSSGLCDCPLVRHFDDSDWDLWQIEQHKGTWYLPVGLIMWFDGSVTCVATLLVLRSGEVVWE